MLRSAVADAMIRTTLESETDLLVTMAEGTGVFKPHEIEALRGVLDDYHDESQEFGHQSITAVQDGRPIGFAYFAPIEMTDRTWILFWIVVDKAIHAKGIGTKLLQHAEEEIARAGGRLFLIETSALPSYEPTRRFYLKHGYEQAATIRDYYADGDDLVTFRKRLQPTPD
jgi:GNAT superfamily N-acetyltransferase